MKERKSRRCPECGHFFKKTMTDNQWRFALFAHLTLSRRHNFMEYEEAKKIVEKELK